MKRIFFITVFSLLSFLFFVSTSLAANSASATISPTLSSIGQSLTYTYTITNGGSSTANIGSAEIQLPVGFGTPSISISSASFNKTWVLVSSGTGKIGIKAKVGSGVDSDKLDVNEFVEIKIITTVPTTPNSYEWIASVWANLDFTGTSFSLSSQPTVNVITLTDTTPPIITLAGSNTINLNVGDAYTELGATAIDDVDGDLTSSIVTDNPVDVNTAGTYTITYDVSDNAGNHAIQVTRTVIVNSIPSVKTESFVIRNGGVIVFEGTRLLPENTIVKIPDNKGVEHDINSRSVLAMLYSIDQTENSFAISNLDYNAGLGSLYVKCLTPSLNNSLCENWQYTVNNIYPGVGMDKEFLAGNERIYIYFGPQNKTLLSKNSITNEEELKVTTEKYDYENNLWVPRTNVTVGLTQPNPDDQWNPIDDIKTAVDPVIGIATFSSIPVGEYDVGVKEDYYWPTEKLTVTEVTHNNGGGGGNSLILHHKVDIDKALQYLSEKQNSDGSFSSDLYTDWGAITAGAGDNSNLKSNITSYLKNNPFDSSVVTDNERHAMALMALGIDPYSGTEINYIQKIVDAFDGTQFGDSSLVNDDIFAILPLIKAGYDIDDEMIQKDISFILSKQEDNGSWGSVDLTASAIQALSLLPSGDVITQAKNQAEQFLINSQQNDGGFGNSFSTSWVLQVIGAMGEDSSDSTWTKNNLNPNDYLFTLQQIDGGVESLTSDENTRIWATSYAIPAVMNKSWGDIMQSFQKPVTQNNSSAGVLENTDLKKPDDHIFCPKGDLFSTITGKPCTNVIETNVASVNIPTPTQDQNLIKKVVNKKNIETSKTNKVINPEEIQNSLNQDQEISVENNLGASAGEATPIKISFKKIPQTVINIVINTLAYIGKGFYDLIIFLGGSIGAVFG